MVSTYVGTLVKSELARGLWLKDLSVLLSVHLKQYLFLAALCFVKELDIHVDTKEK